MPGHRVYISVRCVHRVYISARCVLRLELGMNGHCGWRDRSPDTSKSTHWVSLGHKIGYTAMQWALPESSQAGDFRIWQNQIKFFQRLIFPPSISQDKEPQEAWETLSIRKYTPLPKTHMVERSVWILYLVQWEF